MLASFFLTWEELWLAFLLKSSIQSFAACTQYIWGRSETFYARAQLHSWVSPFSTPTPPPPSEKKCKKDDRVSFGTSLFWRSLICLMADWVLQNWFRKKTSCPWIVACQWTVTQLRPTLARTRLKPEQITIFPMARSNIMLDLAGPDLSYPELTCHLRSP